VVGESWLRETTDVPLALVERLEAELTTVDDGLRFGTVASAVDPTATLEVVEPAADLLADVNGIDAQGVERAVSEHAVAFETVESGNRVEGAVVVADRGAWDRIESTLVDLLRERFDDVSVTADEIVVTERAFDPARARELGVEPGPAFGRLSAGEAVVVDGVEVQPEAVHESRTRRYPR
jgi:D-aminoacyl-tRNA deacylase